MNIITLLKADHKEVSELFKKLLKSRTTANKDSVFSEIYNALTVHAEFEEKTFYPAIKKSAQTKDLVMESFVEHDLMKILLSDIKNAPTKDDSWKAKVTVLEELVKHHVKEEEQDLFVKAKRILDKKQLEEMGKKYLERKEGAG